MSAGLADHPGSADRLAVPVPTPVDLLGSTLFGVDAPVRELPPTGPDGPVGALERGLLRALRRPPCVVSFSGGRDSSAVLALAVDVARRHGLPEPVPVAMRFAGAPAADERRWQEL